MEVRRQDDPYRMKLSWNAQVAACRPLANIDPGSWRWTRPGAGRSAYGILLWQFRLTWIAIRFLAGGADERC